MCCRWLFAFALVAGCGRQPCARHSDCASGERCSAAGSCGVAEDGGPIGDAEGEADAMTPDAGEVPADAGVDASDAGSPP